MDKLVKAFHVGRKQHWAVRSRPRPQEGVVAPWCNPLALQPEQSGGVGLNPGRAPPFERHDKGLQTRLGLLYFCDPRR